MELPILPTDSTYKVAAIGGLMILFGATWSAATQLNGLGLEVAAHRARLERYKAESEYVEFEHAELKARKNGTLQGLKTQLQDLQNLRDKVIEQEAKKRDMEIEVTLTEVKTRNLKNLLSALKIIGAFGLVSAIWGFVQWHRLIQLPQDELIREQIAALRRQRLADSAAETPKANEESKA